MERADRISKPWQVLWITLGLYRYYMYIDKRITMKIEMEIIKLKTKQKILQLH